jgi:predicted TIM-barrel fold metal-dependent hydrolase
MKFEVIDFHTHPFPEAVNNICSHKDVIDMDKDHILSLMDKLGISKFCGSVISSYHPKTYQDGESEWTRIQEQNNIALQLQKYYKGRYIPGFHIHPDFVEESIKEIDKMKGLGVNLIGELVPYMHNYSMTCNALDEILDYAENKDMVLSFHTMDNDSMDKMVNNHKNIKIVLAHPGEKDDILRHIDRMKENENCYLDISGTGILRYGMLARLVKEVGAERILFGSDYPTCYPTPYLYAVTEDEYLTDSEKALILGGNAKRLLNI